MVESGNNNNSLFLPMTILLVNEYDREISETIFFFRFDKVRIPRENLLNSVADVSPDGQYLSAIKDPDQVVILKADYMLLLHFMDQ